MNGNGNASISAQSSAGVFSSRPRQSWNGQNAGQFYPKTNSKRGRRHDHFLLREQPNAEQQEKTNGRIDITVIGRENDSERTKPITGCSYELPRSRGQQHQQQECATRIEQCERRAQKNSIWDTRCVGQAQQQRLYLANEWRMIGRAMQEAKQEHRRTGKPARVFTGFAYRTKKSWRRSRRVVAKAEQIAGKENPRYLVTSLNKEAWSAQKLYEQLYCARGEMENRIKEQLSLFSDRMSTESLRSNQLRLYFSSFAYVLVEALRRVGLAGTEWAEYQAETIRLRLLKIAGQVRITARKIWIRYSKAYPWKNVFVAAWAALRC